MHNDDVNFWWFQIIYDIYIQLEPQHNVSQAVEVVACLREFQAKTDAVSCKTKNQHFDQRARMSSYYQIFKRTAFYCKLSVRFSTRKRVKGI
jgi:hypothetical protein